MAVLQADIVSDVHHSVSIPFHHQSNGKGVYILPHVVPPPDIGYPEIEPP